MYNKFFSQTTNQKRVAIFENSYFVNAHVGGCYSPYNNKVYFAPYQADYVTQFDPVLKTYIQIPIDTEIVNCISIPQYSQGAIYAPNNKIYFSVFSSDHLIVYNLVTEEFEYIFNSGFGGIREGKYNGGVIGNDGFLYLIPYNSSSVCKINLSDNSISFFGSFTFQTHLGGCLAENNCIYQAPVSGNSFRRINLTTNIIGTFGNLGSGSFRWANGCNSLDGRIFFPPLVGTTVLILNPVNETFTQIPVTGGGGYANLQLAPNGNLYGISNSASRFLEVIPSKNIARTFYLNGSNIYHGNVYTEKGIIGVPRQTNFIKILENIGFHQSEMVTFPSDVSTISTSLWNKFQQTL